MSWWLVYLAVLKRDSRLQSNADQIRSEVHILNGTPLLIILYYMLWMLVILFYTAQRDPVG